MCDVPSHTGVAPLHCASLVQATQVPEAVKQRGVAPVQSVVLVAEHWPQMPLAMQAGVAPLQSPSPLQPRQL